MDPTNFDGFPALHSYLNLFIFFRASFAVPLTQLLDRTRLFVRFSSTAPIFRTVLLLIHKFMNQTIAVMQLEITQSQIAAFVLCRTLAFSRSVAKLFPCTQNGESSPSFSSDTYIYIARFVMRKLYLPKSRFLFRNLAPSNVNKVRFA